MMGPGRCGVRLERYASLACRFRATTAAPASGRTRREARAMASSTTTTSMRIDSHLHVWAPKERADEYPYYGSLIGSAKANEPPMPGHVEVLLQEMESAGVSKAVIIQPGNHMFDHAYVSHVLREHPDKFVGVLLANPAGGPSAGARELERLVTEEGYVGVRFNPYLWDRDNGETMDNAVGRAMYERAGQLGVPVSHMPFKGLLGHLKEITALADAFPQTKFIVDHFGFCKCGDLQSEEWQALLSLGREYPQAYVKLSAAFRVSEQEYPYADVRQATRNLIASFGKERLMWGTDFPWVTEQPRGYVGAWSIIAASDEAAGEALLTREEEEHIFHKTARSLFPKLGKQG